MTQLRIHDIDQSWFYVEFILVPEIEVAEKICQNVIDLSAHHTNEKIVFQPDYIGITGDEDYSFYGFGIIKFFIDEF